MPSPTYSRVVALAKDGMPPRKIAVELGIAPRSAHDYLKTARRNGETIPRFDGGGRPVGEYRTLHIKREALEKLATIANERGVQTIQLAADLLNTIAEDDLVDAVLDRGGDDE
ncbi:MAG: hypothetical protein AB7S99_05060 [Pseudodonghicola sp.]